MASWSKCVTLSALVQSAILPAPIKVRSAAVNRTLPSKVMVNLSASAFTLSECQVSEVTLVAAPLISRRDAWTTR